MSRSFLSDQGYGLVIVDTIEEFVAMMQRYTTHPENIFKQSVIQRSVSNYNCFLLTDQAAVEQATRDHATRLIDTDLANPF